MFVGAFALHVLEEAPGFTAWARRYASERYTQRDFVRNNALGLGITGAATYVLARSSRRRGVFLVYLLDDLHHSRRCSTPSSMPARRLPGGRTRPASSPL